MIRIDYELGETGMATFTLDVNGERRTVDVRDPGEPLLYVLRNRLRLTGAKFGCGLGQCGACTVIADGDAVRSCRMPVAEAAGKKITTIEGLGTPDKPHPLQAAFIAEQAAQCGYCTNGMIMTAKALLARTPKPSIEQIKQALEGNLCRCGTHTRILRAIQRASQV
jgi:nicotinate dehydrogenase subunit A